MFLKRAKFDQKQQFLGGFLALARLNLIGSSTKPLNLGSGVTYQSSDTHGYPGGGGVVFSKDLGQVESRSVSVM